MKSKFLNSLLFLSLVALFTGCYYQGPEYYDELDIVYTNYDKDFDFKSHKKYTMPAEIVKVTGNLAAGDKPEYVNASTASLIISTIKSNMSSLGYVYVADTTAADLILFPAALEVTNVTYYYNYYYYYYPYGWYYPYGGTTTTTYQTGTLIMNLLSKNDKSPTNTVPVVWIGAINGLMEGTTAEVNQRAVKAINQAFKQSEYLR